MKTPNGHYQVRLRIINHAKKLESINTFNNDFSKKEYLKRIEAIKTNCEKILEFFDND